MKELLTHKDLDGSHGCVLAASEGGSLAVFLGAELRISPDGHSFWFVVSAPGYSEKTQSLSADIRLYNERILEKP